MQLLVYILFLAVSVTLLFFNYRLRNTLFTPSSYLILVYIFITAMQILGSVSLGYTAATIDLLGIILLFLTIAVAADCMGGQLAKRIAFKGTRLQKKYPSTVFKRHEKQIKITCCVFVAYSLLYFLKTLSIFPNVFFAVQEPFQEIYSGTGGMFYIRLFLMVATAYFWGCAKLNRENILMGFVCLLPNILTFVKGIIFIPCLASILLRLRIGDLKLSIKVFLCVVLSGMIVFFAVYLVEMSIYDTSLLWKPETYRIIYSKLLNYLIAGIQSFNQNLFSTYYINRFRNGENITLAPFINLIAKFGFAESISNVTDIWQDFGYGYNTTVRATSNVNTYIGTLYLYSGVFLGGLINFFWVFVSSFMDEIFLNRRDFSEALSGLFVAGITLGWFEYYFAHTFWEYLVIIVMIVNWSLKIRIKRKW